MYNEYQSPIVNKKEPWGIYIPIKKFIFILVSLIFFFIFVFLFGVYIGKRESAVQLASQPKQTEVASETQPSAETETAKKPEPSKNEAPASINTNLTEGTNEKLENVSPAEKTTSKQTESSVVSATNTEGNTEPPKTADTPITSVPDTSTTNPPTNNPQPTNQIELTPITPPIDHDIINPPTEKQPTSEKAVIPNLNVKQKPKTYSIQLSALTGDDAEKRARSTVEKLQKKYGSQFVFKIQPAGKFYKISVINIPDEKTAREALKILSQENDFKKAFIVKPQK